MTSIDINCPCGKALTLRPELAGKLIRCPACATTLPVPGPEISEGIRTDLPPAGVATAPPPLPQEHVDTIAVAPPVLLPEEPKEAKRKKKRKSVYSDYATEPRRTPWIAFDEGWFASLKGGILGGILTLLIGGALVTLSFATGRFRILGIGAALMLFGLIMILKGMLEL